MSWLDKVDYLDLALQSPARKIYTLDQRHHLCYHMSKTRTHLFHSKAFHLNSLTDLVISLGVSIDKKQQNILQILEKTESNT